MTEKHMHKGCVYTSPGKISVHVCSALLNQFIGSTRSFSYPHTNLTCKVLARLSGHAAGKFKNYSSLNHALRFSEAIDFSGTSGQAYHLKGWRSHVTPTCSPILFQHRIVAQQCNVFNECSDGGTQPCPCSKNAKDQRVHGQWSRTSCVKDMNRTYQNSTSSLWTRLNH